MDVAGIEPTLALSHTFRGALLRVNESISRPVERWAALECGDARHLPVCPDLYSFSVYTAFLTSSSRTIIAFNPSSKLRPLMPQRRSAGIFSTKHFLLRLLTSPRPVHCSARCLTDDLNSVTGLMCDNGYVAILFNVWTSCACVVPELYSPCRYYIVTFTFFHTNILSYVLRV